MKIKCEEGFKHCCGCKEILPLDAFYTNKAMLDGRGSWCKNCNMNLAYARKYNINEQIFQSMLKKQKGLCAICKQPPDKRRLFVDHCHSTKKVRMLLCRKCNLALGYANDDINILKNMIKYLKRFK